MFLGTLGIKDSMLLNWVKGSTHGILKTMVESQEISPKGKVRRASISTRLQHNKVWFNTLSKMLSNYCRKKNKSVIFKRVI